MKWIKCCSMVIVLLPAMCIAETNLVFRVQLTGRGRMVGQDRHGKAVLESLSLKNSDLLNIARGRARTAPVPSNEILALVSGNGSNFLYEVIVFDTISSSNLVTIAKDSGFSDLETISAGTQFESIDLLHVVGTPEIPGLEGGYLTWYTILSATKFSSAIMGQIGFSYVNESGNSDETTLLLPKATLVIQRPQIGMIVDPD